MQRAPNRVDGQRHPLLMQLGQTLHMRLPIMVVQGLDLLRPVLLDTCRISRVVQQSKFLSIISIDLGQRCKLGFDSQGEIIRIKRQGQRSPKCMT
jgi:hypothetical protein